jgi:hypothetical protein
MTIDPKKIREIARVCAILSTSAPNPEERDIFANLASKWLTTALDRETQIAIEMDSFERRRGTECQGRAAEGPSL